MLVVSDINDVFVPLQAGFLADPLESRYMFWLFMLMALILTMRI